MDDSLGAYASATADGGIALYGTAASLRRLASRVRSGGSLDLVSPPPEMVEASALQAVYVLAEAGPVELQPVGGAIEVCGSAESRSKLAESLENLADEPAFGGVVARHLDIEHFPGHGFLSERSAWMTVTLLAAPIDD